MTYIKNNKVLVFIIGVLLLSNIAMLYFYLTKKNCEADNPKKQINNSRGEFMVEKLKNEVGFTDSQIARYREIRVKHKEGMKPLFDTSRLSPLGW